MSRSQESLGGFIGLSGRAMYACPRCGRSAPYDVEAMTASGSFDCPSCRLDMDDAPLLERVTEPGEVTA
ncbi:hypothetical protein G3I44_14070 [Halogeometricum borinquense]|uniref:Uncharacterized protein n=1 Tax=Halogeometricum borinquense TaxID=60847 RepID=A0A6C0UL50_9EURY|nr:hypothetical protein [Halogeometricum borinquense]QIB75313.1 hypothetical protein G3I44_14070 [Halogeometricum borinquense]